MGWAVLYVAFGLVALWLLGEVLLQYKARLRWRLLAFGGFLGVVVGVLLPSVIVIGAGAIAFAIGQTYVTLSFRRGFAAGWSLKGMPGVPGMGGGRRSEEELHQDPTLQVSDLEYEPVQPPQQEYAQVPETAAESTAVYAPQPMPDDTSQYGVYQDSAYAQPAQAVHGAQEYAYDAGSYGYDQQGYGYGYDPAQQPYAAPYSDPYIGAQTYPAQPQYGDPYATGQGYADPYATAAGYGGETPPGGVWVPQQRNGDPQQTYGGELPPEQHYPTYPQHDPNAGYDPNGYNEQQYRY
ncbi:MULTISPECIES: hypothetical protein [unclassified Streptomyces]|uniref:hypothetical protein n=1 Tax=unclassified Streptomyces TaxID=2593676 RepID=UPI00278C81E8|nr:MULTISPECIES: hypothetical protein [unclassified Streptomyces]